jgi:sterol desaturase/sphingolipid hydroxylase (fatty acid hydroxylase superfamily)
METLDWWAKNIFYIAMPYFLVLMAWEWFALRRAKSKGKRGYEIKDSSVSISLGLIKLGMRALCAGYTGWLFAFVYEHRLFTLSPLVWWTWVLLFFADDFTYYWYHRSAHRCRLFWMEHVNHHSSEHYNLSTALRQSTLGPAYTFVFYLPLAFVGFHPLAIAVQFGISLIYQYWIHTEAIDRLGFLEKFMNTPSHHRAHHGSNGIYIDKNYAGILIIWDKLFGTFQEERRDVPVKYGLVHDLKTYSLPTVIFHETAFMLRQVWNAKGWRNKLGWIFGPPEWSPDGPQYPPDHPYWQTQAATKAS